MDIFDVNSCYVCIKVNLDVLYVFYFLNMLLYVFLIYYFLGYFCIFKY